MKKKIIFLVLIVNLALLTFMITNKSRLKINVFPIEAVVPGEIKAVLISDLHLKSFGKGTKRLLEKIDAAQPDIVFLNGDLVNSYDEDIEIALDLTHALSERYPVYFAYGNHEKSYEECFGADISELFGNAGACVLERSFVDISVNGTELRLGGLYDYAFATDNLNSTDPERMDKEVYGFLCDFEDTDRYKIMLSHRPDSFIFGQAAATWDIDLVLSGHTHGGQVVLPFFGGLWAGDQGFFPEYVHGFYEKENIKMVITSGLGSSKQALPRFNNPPEIAEIIITPKVGG